MPPAQRPASILLIDDSRADRHLLDLVCRQSGLEVDWQAAGSCHEARHLLATITAGEAPQPRLVIADQRLPDGLGTDLVEEITDHLDDIPLVIFSTSSASSDRHRIPDGSHATYLVKPHSVRGYETIIAHIRAAVEQSS